MNYFRHIVLAFGLVASAVFGGAAAFAVGGPPGFAAACAADTVWHYGSIAHRDGVAGLRQEVQEHPVLAALDLFPFVPKVRVSNILASVKGMPHGSNVPLVRVVAQDLGKVAKGVRIVGGEQAAMSVRSLENGVRRIENRVLDTYEGMVHFRDYMVKTKTWEKIKINDKYGYRGKEGFFTIFLLKNSK